MAEIALIAVAAGSALAGGVMQAKAAQTNAEAASNAARYNEAQALQQSAAEGSRRRRMARRELSSQRVAFAKAGVLLEGSPLELLAQNAAEFEVDALNVEIAARNTADLERRRGRVARRVGRQQTGAALLSGASRAAGIGARFF